MEAEVGGVVAGMMYHQSLPVARALSEEKASVDVYMSIRDPRLALGNLYLDVRPVVDTETTQPVIVSSIVGVGSVASVVDVVAATQTPAPEPVTALLSTLIVTNRVVL